MYEEMTGVKAKQIVVMISVDHEEPQIFVKHRSQYIPGLVEKVSQFRKDMKLWKTSYFWCVFVSAPLLLLVATLLYSMPNVSPETERQIRVIKEKQAPAPWIEEFEEQIDTSR